MDLIQFAGQIEELGAVIREKDLAIVDERTKLKAALEDIQQRIYCEY